MTKKLVDITLAILLLSCSAAIWLGIVSIKSVAEHYIALAEETRQAQAEIIQTSKEVQEVIFEAGMAFAVIALSEEKIIPPTEAEKMITESIEKIDGHSDRLGTLAKYINDYRIEQQRMRGR